MDENREQPWERLAPEELSALLHGVLADEANRPHVVLAQEPTGMLSATGPYTSEAVARAVADEERRLEAQEPGPHARFIVLPLGLPTTAFAE